MATVLLLGVHRAFAATDDCGSPTELRNHHEARQQTPNASGSTKPIVSIHHHAGLTTCKSCEDLPALGVDDV
jgi:hypothetical protein